MIIGVDFDNTIVCYDFVFHQSARERNLIPAEIPPSKATIRDFIRDAGREDEWTALQGDIYGKRMHEAEPYSGVIEFLRVCRRLHLTSFIISHKTRHPYRGERYDLHKAAYTWLERFHLESSESDSSVVNGTFFEPTMEAKLRKIQDLECDYFVDDLPEFLCRGQFPADTERILFDPHNVHADDGRYTRFQSWKQIHAFFRKLLNID